MPKHYTKCQSLMQSLAQVFLVTSKGPQTRQSKALWYFGASSVPKILLVKTLYWRRPQSCQKKADFLQKVLDNQKKMPIWGLGGLGGSIFIVNIIERIAQKLRRILLLHLGLVTFRIHFTKDRPPPIFMVFGFSDVSTTPKTNYFLSLEAPGYSN